MTNRQVQMYLIILYLFTTNVPQFQQMKVYLKVSGLAAWSENYKWYSSLPLGADVLLFCESV
jgi:hypothetical protein